METFVIFSHTNREQIGVFTEDDVRLFLLCPLIFFNKTGQKSMEEPVMLPSCDF